MRCAEPKAGDQTIGRLGAAILLVTALALAVTGPGCTAVRQTQSVSSPSAIQSVSSQVTTESIKVQIQTKMAQRNVLMDELKSLDARIAAESLSSTSISRAKTQSMHAQRSSIAARLDALDTELEVDSARYDALESSTAAGP